MLDKTSGVCQPVLVEVRFTQAARRHRVGQASALHVMAHAVPIGTVTGQGNPGWLYVGLDERGRELEIVAVEIEDEKGRAVVLVLHVMPTLLRGSDPYA